MFRHHWLQQQARLYEASLHGVLTVAQLAALGVAANTSYRRCELGGPWQRHLPGVVVLHNGPVAQLQRVAAAVLYAGPDAVVTGAAACAIHQLPVAADDDVHVLIPRERRRQSHGYVRVERTARLPQATRLSGLPVAPVARAAVDLARASGDLDACRALFADVLRRRKSTAEALRRELAQASFRGTAIPRHVLAELGDGAHAVVELQAQRLWQRAGLPTASWHHRLVTADGSYVATPDAWCPDAAFAWEIDSAAPGDVARSARYAAAGVTVLRTPPARLRDEPDSVVTELRNAFTAARQRPRPRVVLLGAAA